MAMSPAWSMAMLPIQRKLESGANVDCWATMGVPLGFWSSYQRTPPLLPAVTEWFTTSDSWVPKLRYARRYIRRSASESNCWLVPGWGTQVPPPHSAPKAVTGITVGPVNVELAGVVKSTWNLNRFRLLLPKNIRKLGEPAGGAVVPSRSEGSSPPTELPSWKHTCVAAAPLSMAVRLYAQASEPTKLLPLNILKVWE